MILITGGGGFIGLNTTRYLVDKGQEVLLVRRHDFQVPSFLIPYANKQIRIISGDITELPFLYRVITEHRIDSIIHLAMMREDLGRLYQVLKANVGGTTEILEAAHIFCLRRVTFCSSEAVYIPVKTRLTLHEDMDLPSESSSYVSATKKAGEQICQLYAKEYGLSVPIVRAPSVWGPLYSSQRQPIQLMFENAAAGRPTDYSHIFGEKKGNRIYIKDFAKAIGSIHLAPSLKHNIYNVSDDVLYSLSDFAKAIKEVIPDVQIRLGKTKTPQDEDFPAMSIGRIKEELGFTIDYDLRRAVRDYIDWLREEKY